MNKKENTIALPVTLNNISLVNTSYYNFIPDQITRENIVSFVHSVKYFSILYQIIEQMLKYGI